MLAPGGIAVGVFVWEYFGLWAYVWVSVWVHGRMDVGMAVIWTGWGM